MVAMGTAAAWNGTTYGLGTPSRMGPGFFPTALGVVLVLIGIAIAVGGMSRPRTQEPSVLAPEWRGWFCITLSIIAFVVLGKISGLVPATVGIVFISALGDRRNTLKSALVLTAGMVAVAIVVFWWAIQVQFPLFGVY